MTTDTTRLIADIEIIQDLTASNWEALQDALDNTLNAAAGVTDHSIPDALQAAVHAAENLALQANQTLNALRLYTQ